MEGSGGIDQSFLSGDPVFFSGELVKESTRIRRRKLRYFRLVDGALYNYRKRGDAPSVAYSVIDCKLAATNGMIQVRMTDGTELVLHASNSQIARNWADMLRRASKRKMAAFYGIHGIIGVGAFAEVRLGYLKRTGQQVAIKIMRKNKNDHELMTAVNCELNFISRNIRHENIVSTYDIINTREILFIVMEYMEAGMLYDVLAGEKMLSEKKASHVMKCLLEALAFLHQHDIVHRDVKPENILCSGREWPLTIKLADFGLADVIMEDNFGDKSSRGMYGTPFFVAPEVIKGDSYGPAVDIWSAGVLMYNMLSGQLPFEGSTLPEVLRSVKAGHVRYPSHKWAFISPEAKSLIQEMLTYDPQKRVSAEKALNNVWFKIAPEREEFVTGNTTAWMNSKEARLQRSSIAIEDVESMLRDVKIAQEKVRVTSNPAGRLGPMKIYRRVRPQSTAT